MNNAAVSAVFNEDDEFAFIASIRTSATSSQKRFAHTTKKDATKKRASLIKHLKGQGFKILMTQ